jgi:hypothetical protein
MEHEHAGGGGGVSPWAQFFLWSMGVGHSWAGGGGDEESPSVGWGGVEYHPSKTS